MRLRQKILILEDSNNVTTENTEITEKNLTTEGTEDTESTESIG